MNIIILENQSLVIYKSTSGNLDYNLSYVDISADSVTRPISQQATISAIGDTTLLSGVASFSRKLNHFSAINRTASEMKVEVKTVISAVETLIHNVTLQASESFELTAQGLIIYSSTGEVKSIPITSTTPTTTDDVIGYSADFMKVSTTPEATGVMYSFLKDAGTPGALIIGTPGIDGRNVEGSTEPGCVYVPDVVDKSIFLRSFNISSSIAGVFHLFDLLWINTGLSVTTATAQSISQPIPVQRFDASRTSAGLLVTSATTYALPVNNIVISYTNEKFVSGRVGTMPSFPSTAVIGTFVPFLLASGDKGISSIQSITFPTSLTSGAISLIMFERIFSTGIPVTYIGSNAQNVQYEIPIKSNACLLPFWLASAPVSMNIMGNLYFVYKNS